MYAWWHVSMSYKQCKPGGVSKHWTDDAGSFASPLNALGEIGDLVLSDGLLVYFLLIICFTDIDLFFRLCLFFQLPLFSILFYLCHTIYARNNTRKIHARNNETMKHASFKLTFRNID